MKKNLEHVVWTLGEGTDDNLRPLRSNEASNCGLFSGLLPWLKAQIPVTIGSLRTFARYYKTSRSDGETYGVEMVIKGIFKGRRAMEFTGLRCEIVEARAVIILLTYTALTGKNTKQIDQRHTAFPVSISMYRYGNPMSPPFTKNCDGSYEEQEFDLTNPKSIDQLELVIKQLTQKIHGRGWMRKRCPRKRNKRCEEGRIPNRARMPNRARGRR